MPRSGSRAKPNRTSTRTANGRDLLGGHLRAQLDPQVLARDEGGVTEHGSAPRSGRPSAATSVVPPAIVTDAVGPAPRPGRARGRRARRSPRRPTAWRTRSSTRSRPSWSSPAWGSSSSHSSGRRASRQASDGAPALAGRQAGDGQARPGGRRGRAVRARRRRRRRAAPAARPQNRTLSATVRSSYRPVAWPSRPTRRRTARAAAGRARSWPEHRGLARGRRGSRPGAAGAAAWSCRRRSGRGGARSRRPRRRGRPRPGRGTGRGASPRRGGGRRVPWEPAKCYGRPSGRDQGGRGAADSLRPMRLAQVPRGGRARLHHGGRPHPAVRRLPALGHRDPRGPGPEPARGRLRRGARRGRPDHDDHHHRDHVPRRTGDGAAHRARCPRARPTARIGSRRSASTRSSSRAWRSPTSRRGPGHYPRRRCPGRRATPPSPATAPPTARRSTGSTSSSRATRSSSRPCRASSPTIVKRDSSSCRPPQVEVLEDKGDNRLTLTACHPKYSARAAHRRGRRARPGRGGPCRPGDRSPTTRRRRRARRHRRRGRPGLAGDPPRPAVRGDLAAGLARRPPVAEVAGLPDRASRSSWWRSSSSSRSSAACCPANF